MENNNFDKILKEKMEGFNPHINPAHVAKSKVFILSKLATKSIFLTTAFWGATATIAAIVVAGIFYFNPTQNSTYTKQEITGKTIKPSVENEIVINKSKDTNLSKKSDPEILTSNEIPTNNAEKTIDQSINNRNFGKEKNLKQPKFLNDNESPLTEKEETALTNKVLEIIEIDALTIPGFPVTDVNNTCEKVALSYLQKSLKKEEPPIIPKLQFNLGLGYQGNKQGNSYSGELEVTKKNIMLNTGVQFTKLKPVNYQTKVEFERKRGHEFLPPPNDKEKNRPKHFHDTNMVKNISQQTNIVSIPITIQYKVPVYGGLSVFGAITSQIDISAKQEITFEYQSNKHLPPITGNSSAKVSVKPMNRFQTRLGIQQATGRISLRLFPTYSINVKKTEYNPLGNKFGLGFQVIYRLK